MIAELVAILLAAVIGLPLALLIDRRARGAVLAGEALLFGIGACGAILFLLALLHLPWTRMSFGVAYAVFCVAAWIVAWGKRPVDGEPRGHVGIGSALLIGATAVVILGYAIFATLAPPAEFDYLADWGAKGRVFFEAETIDWHFLETASYRATHSDYPPLLPLTFDLIAVVRGGWIDAHLGIVNVVFAIALLLVVYGVSRNAFIVFAMTPLAALPWLGIADGPFAACATAALLLLRDDAHGYAGAVMLGLAASLKNEGLALIAAVALARPRRAGRLWPAVVIALPWLIVRMMHRLPTDVVAEGVVGRVIEHLREPSVFVALAHESLGKPLFWIALLAAFVAGGRDLLRGERFVLTALALQLLFYIGAYLATPHDVEWHVRWSWERLVAHLTPALTFVVLRVLLEPQMATTSVSLDTSISSN
jgi:hypothetical protein